MLGVLSLAMPLVGTDLYLCTLDSLTRLTGKEARRLLGDRRLEGDSQYD
jgi:hypothetical protein